MRAATAKRTKANGEARPAAAESGGWVVVVGVELVEEAVEEEVLLAALAELLAPDLEAELALELALAVEEAVSRVSTPAGAVR